MSEDSNVTAVYVYGNLDTETRVLLGLLEVAEVMVFVVEEPRAPFVTLTFENEAGESESLIKEVA